MLQNAEPGRNNNERLGTPNNLFHKVTETRRQGDCDRGSIRVFEEKLASQPHGDWLSGERDAQEAVSRFIIETAKEAGLFIEHSRWTAFGERKRLPSGESIIYENSAQGIVYKVRDPFAKLHLKSGRSLDVLYDHVIHNLLFPNAAYRLIGISELSGGVRMILAQPFVYTYAIPTKKQIEEYLMSIGLQAEDHYYYGNEWLAVTDVSDNSDNVVFDNNGELLFIDPIIKFKKPALGVIEHYIKNGLPTVEYSKEDGLLSRLLHFVQRIYKIFSI